MPWFESDLVTLLAMAAMGYLLGSIPFGLVLTRVLGLSDPRTIGSGNIGATNVLRTGSKAAAAGTLLLDGAKGAVAVLVARWITGHEDAGQAAGIAAFLGHLYPVWLGFKGGKGVATFFGVTLALSLPVGAVAALTWLLAAAVTRYSSLSAIIASALSPVYALLFGYPEGLLITTVLCTLIYYRHGTNVKRLKDGTEPKIGQKA
ncbi:MAG: glycerol-3-phosphate 1-O-acyltransferase PlsY [Rhodobacteraceae bacterium]|jgi:glycerol-3-phosphate acyltransferase PlsY|nr:glycerol-3-phosphate 1-O-acyltransferase PlsY [Paracoccaceae bacterium]